MTDVLSPLLDNWLGIASILVMGTLVVETAAMCLYAEMHLRTGRKLRVQLGRYARQSPAELGQTGRTIGSYLDTDLERLAEGLDLNEDIAGRAGMAFTFVAIGLMLPSFWQTLLNAPDEVFAMVAVAIWTSAVGIVTSIFAGIQCRRLRSEMGQLELTLTQLEASPDTGE